VSIAHMKISEQGDNTCIGWQCSGFSNSGIGHFIVDKGDYLKTLCGLPWMMSDAVTSKQANDGRHCQNCEWIRREVNHESIAV